MKSRIFIDFQYNKAMGDLMHFEILRCYKRALCEISDENLEFTIFLNNLCVLLFWFGLFCKMNCVCVGIV